MSQNEDLPEGPYLQSMPSEQIRNQLTYMAQAIDKAITLIKPTELQVQSWLICYRISKKVAENCACCSPLSLKSGLRLTSILVFDLCFPSPSITDPVSLSSPLPPCLALVFHSQNLFTNSVVIVLIVKFIMRQYYCIMAITSVCAYSINLEDLISRTTICLHSGER